MIFCDQLISYVQSVYKDLYDIILMQKELRDTTQQKLRTVIEEFSKLFVDS